MVRGSVFMLLAAVLCLPACQMTGVSVTGSGKIVTEARQVSGFTRVVIAGSGDAVLVQGAEEGVVVEADDNLMQYVRTEVRDGALYLDTRSSNRPMSISPSKTIRFTVTLKSLDGITVSGAGDVTAEAIATPKLDIAVSGAGDVSIGALKTEALAVAVSGAGNIELSGEAGIQSVAISGAGDYVAGDLRSASASVAISGAGDATVWATDTLEARVSGMGSVGFYGEPTVTRSVSGVGSIEYLGTHGTSI
jgi:hypothetical protein